MNKTYYSIEHEGRYWQCGVWVKHLNDATKYDSEDQAEAALAMRQMNGCIVPNDTVWRNLTADKE